MREEDVGRRGAPRSKVDMPAELSVDERTWRVSLRDISQTGAALCHAPPIPVGTRVRIRAGSLEGNGTVAWASHERLGVRFDARVPIHVMREVEGALPCPPYFQTPQQVAVSRRSRRSDQCPQLTLDRRAR